MYNGIGLTTPRGSGTNGYVVRNLSVLRRHDNLQDRQSAWDAAPPKHREPDEAILEHERKRKVEVKCLELQLELEENDIDEDEIEKQVSALREKLLKNLAAFAPATRSLKSSDTHALAAAKRTELDKMARALGTRADYQEGDAFDREKQEEIRMKRIAERDERAQRKKEEHTRMAEQKAKWESERRERDRLRAEDRAKREKEHEDLKRKEHTIPAAPVPTGPRDGRKEEDRYSDRRRPYQHDKDRRSRSRSPRRRDYMPPPPPRDRDHRGSPPRPSRTRPPLARRYDSRSPSRSPPPDRRRLRLPRSGTSPPSRHETAPSGRRAIQRSASPLHSRSPSSRSPPRAPTSSPPAHKRGRSPSVASTGSSMSVSSRSSASSRSRSHD